jgi:hypothetical protein
MIERRKKEVLIGTQHQVQVMGSKWQDITFGEVADFKQAGFPVRQLKIYEAKEDNHASI